MPNLSQKKVFLESEGDRWFERNKAFLEKTQDHPPEFLKILVPYLKKEYKILEIGCSAGHTLNSIQVAVHCDCYGVDPSNKAIESGKKKYPQLNISIGTSDALNFSDEYFDVVIFGFCLYLVDRKLLAKSIAEVDRVLKNQGYLAIIDFDTKIPKKRVYKHSPGLYSYKMDYSRIFLAFPHYSMADKYCYSHSSIRFVEDPSERVSLIMLYKNQDDCYVVEDDT